MPNAETVFYNQVICACNQLMHFGDQQVRLAEDASRLSSVHVKLKRAA